MYMKKVLILMFCVFLNIEGANILSLFPLPLYSHSNSFMPVLRALRSRGHNITVVSPFPQKEVLSNWTDIVIKKEPFSEFLANAQSDFSATTNIYLMVIKVWRTWLGLMNIAHQDKALQNLIKDDNLNFDLIIAEPFFAQESLVAFGHKLNTPVISIFPLALSPWASYMSGNPVLLPYIPHYRTSYTDEMTFMEKLDNLFISILELFYGIFFYFPKQEEYMEKYMVYKGSENRPTLREMLKNVSLHLIDYHYSVGYVQPLQPNTIPIGGLSLKISDPLPEDLQKYIDGSPNGVIYMSFGSHKPVSSLDQRSVDAIIATFRNLEVNVLLKWEADSLPNQPKNVKTMKWLPQASILAHPKCRLFITHGGLHSISEASYYGVPVVVIPFFADQEYNAKFARKVGFGYFLDKDHITQEKFKLAIETVLHNNSYKEVAAKRSLITKDNPMSPLDTAVYWIEYVLRHKDVSHLRPGSTNHALYELFLYDVLLIFLLAVLLLILVAFVVCKSLAKLISRFMGSTSKKKQE